MLRRVSAFGPEIVPIVESAREHAILTSRDPARLNAFLDFPRQSMSGWHLFDETGRLRGLAVLNVIPKDGGRTRTGKVVDCLLDDVDVDLWHAAFAALTGELTRQGADLAQAYASTPWAVEALRRSGYASRYSVKFHIRDRQGLIPKGRAVPPHAAGGGLCLYLMMTVAGNRGSGGHGPPARASNRRAMPTLIWLDLSSPRHRFFRVGLPAGTVDDRPRPHSIPRGGQRPGGFHIMASAASAFVSGASSWRGPRGPAASDFVTTVDQSDIRGLVTGMRSIRQGLPLSTDRRRSPPCGRP